MGAQAAPARGRGDRRRAQPHHRATTTTTRRPSTSSPGSWSREGTYVSTTAADSRLERVTVEGLGNRARATLVVSRGDADELVRIERQGETTVVIPEVPTASRRAASGGWPASSSAAPRLVVLRWRAEDGTEYDTGFLPRYKADIDRIESALWWHSTTTGDDPGTPASEGHPTP